MWIAEHIEHRHLERIWRPRVHPGATPVWGSASKSNRFPFLKENALGFRDSPESRGLKLMLCLWSWRVAFCVTAPRRRDLARVHSQSFWPVDSSWWPFNRGLQQHVFWLWRPVTMFFWKIYFFQIHFPTSDRTRLPAEFKHITKRRKRN